MEDRHRKVSNRDSGHVSWVRMSTDVIIRCRFLEIDIEGARDCTDADEKWDCLTSCREIVDTPDFVPSDGQFCCYENGSRYDYIR